MADQTRTFRVELEAGFASFSKTFTSAGKSVDGLSKSVDKLADSTSRAADRGPGKLGSSFDSTSAKAGRLADGLGRVSTTLARSADSFGLPVASLRALDDAADVAELGLANLSKGMAGFNTATLGVIGAGAAIGAALGSFANRFEFVRKTADDATRGLYDFLAAHKLFGEATRDQGAGQEAGLRQFSQAMAANNLEAIKTQIKNQRELGATTEQLAKLYKNLLTPAQMESLGIGEKQVVAQKKGAEAAKKTAEEFQRLVDQLSGASAQKEVDQLTLAFDKLGVEGVGDLEALRAKLEQLGKQGAKITSKGLLGVLAGGKIEIPKELGDLDLGASLGELDPAILAQSQQTFTSIAQSAAAAGLSTKEIEDALQGAGASGGQLEVALAAIPVSFGSVFKDTLSQLPNVILSAIQGGGDVGKSVGSFFGGSFLGGLTGEKGPLSVGNLSKVFGDTFGGAINAILPGLGSLLGAGLGSLLGKLFGDKTIMKLNDVRDAFFETHGGYQQLGADLTAILNSGDKASALIKELFDAKTPEQFDAAVAKVKEILSSLNDSVEPVTIPVNIEVTGGDAAGVALPALEEAIPSFAEGTRGFQDFGAGTLAMLHGMEAVVPEGSSPDLGGGDVYNISVPINENPLQTFEGLQRQREFTIKTVRRDLTRSLSQAVSAGVA